MRIAIFVAVVAAHIAVVWYFLTLWHHAAAEDDDQSAMTLVLLAPMQSAPEPKAISPMASTRERPEPPQAASVTQPELASQPASASPALIEPTAAVPPPDWREAAEVVAQADAQHIVEAEDRAARQAGALTAMIKPLPGPYLPGPSFHWDPNPRYHWQRAQGGGWVMPLNDHCDIAFFIMLWVGCTVGELPPARGDLFKNMHPPVKFGDWDWRVDDP